ncbi:MAG: hypothetical protein A2X36_01475 [Elusimicrobia bacterium GWA2_69_24]|nr:MAG: hypothetical protein A2X36_01475 [Elusimicrobia bacterium GWA2_69_24]HBL17125.1 hypothetical protein [Elusimicrobiota bacterium]
MLLLLAGMSAAAAQPAAEGNPFQIGRCDRFEAKDVARLRSIKAGVEAYFAAHPSTETLPAVPYGREQVLLLTSYATWSVVLDGQGLCSDEGKICAVLPPAWTPAERRAADADVRDPVDTALAEAGVPGDWRRHEDAWLRFSYPASWEVPRSTLAITIGQAGKSRTPIMTRVQIKWPETAGSPRFTIERQTVKEKDSGTEDRAVFRIGELHIQGWRLLSPVEHPAVPGAASCVLFAMEEPRRVCEDASGGMQECHRAMLDLECRRANADRLLVAGIPSPYAHGGAVDGPALEQIADFKRLLCGIALP